MVVLSELVGDFESDLGTPRSASTPKARLANAVLMDGSTHV